MRIEACFDSHVHWAATGEFSQRLFLTGMKSPEDILNMKPEMHHSRGEWLLGFGWDDNAWKTQAHRRVLDQWYPDRPVALSRGDGHALWLNSEALRRAGLLGDAVADPRGGRIVRDETGQPTGVLVDQACELVHKLIPRTTGFEVRRFLLKAVQIFNEAGFTHIRDMTCDEMQWNEAVRLDQSGLLTLAVEEYFWLKNIADLDRQLDLVALAKSEDSPNLRVKGLKIFLDGALGSEGAWLSRCYHGRDHSGLILWEDDALKETLRRSWERGLAVAVHAIGDEAADRIVNLALHVKAMGIKGSLHLEHGELIRPETIEKMRGLDITCHLQPAHWLSDRAWLSEKVGDLAGFAFPWRRLQEADIAFDFGSDSPIEAASVTRTLQALRESAEAGVPRLLGLPMSYMSHRDLSWAANSFTLFEDEKPKQLVFRGEHIL
jgi:predicted amidohydrolase YtcJ